MALDTFNTQSFSMKFFSIIFSLLIFNILQSQEFDSVVSFSDDLLVKVNVNTQNESFSIQDDSEENFTIGANNVYRLEVSANYKFLGLSIGFSPGNGNSNFKSSFLDYQLRLFLGQWIQNFQYRKVQGFYEESVILNEESLQFPHLKTTNWNGATSYVLNPRLSLKHLLYLTEWQRESAGSLIPTLKYGYNKLSGQFGDEKLFQNNFDIALVSSYYYTWVVKRNWFISPSLSPALGVRFSSDESDEKDTFVTKALNFSLQFGYTNDRISAGASFSFDSNSVSEDVRENVINDKSYASIYFGYRFNPPRYLKEKVEWINRKIGL